MARGDRKARPPVDRTLSAVAEAPASRAAADNRQQRTKSPRPQAKTSKSSTDAKTSKAGTSKTPAGAPAATPSVPLPFALHAGGTIEKEYHVRWPQDLASFGFGFATSDPLSVDYIRLQGQGEFGKALTHYRGAIAAVPRGQAENLPPTPLKAATGSTSSKKTSGNRTRSVDVLVTREPRRMKTARNRNPKR